MKNRSVPLLYAITFLFFFSLYVYTPNLPVYAASLSASLTVIGLLTGMYGLAQGVIRIPIGIVSDRLKRRKPFVVLGCALAVLSALGFCLTRSAGVLLLFRGLAGAAVGFWVSITVLFSSYYPPGRKIYAIGVVNSANFIGTSAATTLGGYLAGVDMALPFIFSLASAAAALVLSCFLKDVVPSGELMRIESVKKVSKNGRLWLLASIALLAMLLSMTLNLTFTPLIAKNLGATATQLGLLGTAHMLPMVPTAFFTNAMVNRFGARSVVTFGALLCIIPCVFTPIAPLAWVFVLQFALGAGVGLSFNTCFAICLEPFKPELQSTAMGLFQTIYSVGIFAGPTLTGALSAAIGFEKSYLVLGAVALFAAGLAFFGLRSSTPSGAPRH